MAKPKPTRIVPNEWKRIRNAPQPPRDKEQEQQRQKVQSMKERVRRILKYPNSSEEAMEVLVGEFGLSQEDAKKTIIEVQGEIDVQTKKMSQYREKIAKLKDKPNA